MTFICCVPGCKNSGKRILHSFPKNEEVCRKWIAKTKCFFLNKATAYTTHHKVCRNHFQMKDLRNWNLLHKGAVPSLVLPSKVEFAAESFRNFQDSLLQQNTANTLINISSDVPRNDFNDDLVYEDVEILDEYNNNHSHLSCDSLNYSERFSADEVVVSINTTEGAQNNNKTEELLSLDIEILNPNTFIPEECSYFVEDLVEDTLIDQTATVNIEMLNQDYPSPFIIDDPDFLENQNVENIADSQIPKPSRKYDPVARKLRYQSTRIKFLTRKIKNLENIKDSNLLNYLSTKLPPEQFQLVRLLLRNAGRASQGRRFSFEDKTMALSIYKQSPKCYGHLRKMFGFPSKQTLNKHAAKIRFQEGVNPKLLQFIKDSSAKLNKNDKNVTIAWDEIALSAHLDFQETKDYIDGFQDLGTSGTNSFATHALVFMIRGLTSAYKQPVAYFLTENISSGELSALIKLIIEAVFCTGMLFSITPVDHDYKNSIFMNSNAVLSPALYAIQILVTLHKVVHPYQPKFDFFSGLNVMGSVCDSVASNVAAVNKLIKPKCKKGLPAGDLLEYKIDGSSIIHIYDPPHLIKTVRNHLMTKNLEHIVAPDDKKYQANGIVRRNENNEKKFTASWNDVKALYQFDSKRMIKLLPKITDEHITPKKKKMKVRVATQVFSETYGRNMYFLTMRKQLPSNCVGTAHILLFFNQLFDSLNGGFVAGKNDLKCPITPTSNHFEFWDYATKMLNNMKLSANLETGKASRSSVLKHFVSALKGMRKLCERLFELDVTTVSPRQLNQDALENFFGCIRFYCNSKTITARQFRCAYSTAIINNLTSKHSRYSNCEEDNCKPLLYNLQILFESTEEACKKNDVAKNLLDSINLVDLGELQMPEIEAQNYMVVNIGQKLLRKTKCIPCCDSIKTEQKSPEPEFICHQSSVACEQVYPNTEFLKTVKNTILKTEQLLQVFCADKNLKQKIINCLLEEEENNANGDLAFNDESKLGCELHCLQFRNELKNITVVFVIQKFIKNINNLLKGEIELINEKDALQQKALAFRKKKKHIGKYFSN